MEKQKTTDELCLESYLLENTPDRIVNRYEGLATYAQNHTFGVLDKSVVVIDTETTGFSFNHDELIQIAAARMTDGEITDWYITFVNPGKPIPDEVAHLTNIHDEDVADAPDPDTALEQLVEFVGDSYLVAHNANFDRTFVTKREAGASLKENIWVDSLDLARIALPRMNSHRLLDLVRAFGGPDSTHRADDDVASTCLVYRILLAAVAAMPDSLVVHIAEMAELEDWNTVYIFKTFAEAMSAKTISADTTGAETVSAEATSAEATSVEPYRLMDVRREAAGRLNDHLRQDAFKPTTAELEQALQENGAGGKDTAGAGAKDATSPAAHPVELHFVDDAAIEHAFSTEGIVGKLYEDYEMRDEQKTMALAVNRAIAHSENLVVEAGTGVGKSMAYLVPLALAAKENNITVGVATKTNTLLDQLVNKELPLLKRELGISYAPLKGFVHYPCMRKINQIDKQGARPITYKNQVVQQAPALAGLLSFIDQTDYDDIDGLKIDYRALPRWSITTKSAECLRRKCPFFGRTCFVHGAREQAQRSDVVVTNHSLLFWDIRCEGGLLPPVRYWVVDEAHGAETEARRAFSLEVSSEAIHGLVRKLTNDSARTNVLIRAERTTIVEEEGKRLYTSLVHKAQSAAQAFGIAGEEFTLRAKDLLYFDEAKRSRGYEYFDLWLSDEIRASETFRSVASSARSLYDTTEKLIAAMRDIVAYTESLDDSSEEQRELALAALELRELYEGLDQVFFTTSENKVYAVRLNRTKDKLNEVFTVQPLDVGISLNESLYQETNSVIYTSATLAVDHHFDSFNQGIGLNEGEESKARCIEIESNYDFDSNMAIFIPSDMPEPSDPHYLDALQTFLAQLHVAQQGSLLTLFTNRKEMEKCFDAVNPVVKAEGLRLVCQKWGVSVKGLRDDFLKDEHLSLFALKSFWEGFDAPGSTLRGVVIPKLPFGLPTDPLSCERSQRDDRAWAHYSLPSAVIDVKQAVGRLIRRADDNGIVVLADTRLITKYYGKKFLNSLPSKNISILPMDDIIEQVCVLQQRAEQQRAGQQRAEKQHAEQQRAGQRATQQSATKPSVE